MSIKIEHYTKVVSYAIDVEFNDILYTAYIGATDGELEEKCEVVDMDSAQVVDPNSDTYTAIIAAVKKEIAIRENTDIAQLRAEIQQLSDPLIMRDSEKLQEDLSAINQLVTNQ